ncbi:hypothetical protein [Caldimonas brevitalea]|uniref:Outer membrane protein beta-barrel domain-containing protein n=1 Tax=Caldimonas brevitalea TaxID=413882 RepID=A0A0G3BFV9_9BURK|nr:hypothetical protein [Caldimonas brevitalea]AKJ26838.1 hypothetical protein AAW51_0147 [Caldimonas brevitalea]
MNCAVLVRCAAATALLGSLASVAQAGEVYGGFGLPGVMIGYAHAINSSFTVRADFATLGEHDLDGEEEGIDYEGDLKLHRTGVFADWFPTTSAFRLTGGITFNRIRADLVGRPTGNAITIGDTTYAATAEDRFDVSVKFPTTTPYIGLGWGHQLRNPGGAGWVVTFDVGGSIGKAKVRGTVSGPLLSQTVSQEDIDRELEELEDGVGKVRFIPQVSIGVSYRF